MPDTPSSSEPQNVATDNDSGSGPAPHEDLTIAEEIETMKLGNEHRPGEECFLDDEGGKHWVDDGKANDFIREYGALHSSDYESIHGTKWQDDFFAP